MVSLTRFFPKPFPTGFPYFQRRNFTSAVCAASVWLVYTTARPVATRYLVTLEKYGRLSARGAQVTLVAAEQIAGLQFTDAQREMMLEGVNDNLALYEELRRVPLDVSVAPALPFSPILPGMTFDKRQVPFSPTPLPSLTRPKNLEDVAFWSVIQLATLIKSRKVSSVELTEVYLARLKRYDPVLKCVVTFTEELAMQQARRVDAEVAAGKYNGYLHGIPWGVKD